MLCGTVSGWTTSTACSVPHCSNRRITPLPPAPRRPDPPHPPRSPRRIIAPRTTPSYFHPRQPFYIAVISVRYVQPRYPAPLPTPHNAKKHPQPPPHASNRSFTRRSDTPSPPPVADPSQLLSPRSDRPPCPKLSAPSTRPSSVPWAAPRPSSSPVSVLRECDFTSVANVPTARVRLGSCLSPFYIPLIHPAIDRIMTHRHHPLEVPSHWEIRRRIDRMRREVKPSPADSLRRYGTAKSGVGISAMAVLRPDLMMKCVVPVIMAGIIAIVSGSPSRAGFCARRSLGAWRDRLISSECAPADSVPVRSRRIRSDLG